MTPPDPAFQSAAQRLIQDVAAGGEDAATIARAAEHIFQRLHDHLGRLIGVIGFRTLLARSHKLAKPGLPALARIEVRPDGTIVGLLEALSPRSPAEALTTFLIGEYTDQEVNTSPLFMVADGILWLSQVVERNSVIRKLQVIKVRGQNPMGGLQSLRISQDGVEVFPRMPVPLPTSVSRRAQERITSGLPELDVMLHGGFLAGNSILVAGPAGTGKTLLSTQFIAAGVSQGHAGVIAVFEEQPDRYVDRARFMGVDLQKMIDEGQVKVLYPRPVDLSVDETLHAILALVAETHAERVVIDSLSGFELAVAPSFREDFRESLYRTIATLTATGITVMMTVEVLQSFTDLRFSPHEISFLADNLIIQRYVEMEGQIRRVLAVMKMRGSAHDTHLRLYAITTRGIHIGSALEQYRGILTGIPTRIVKKRSNR